MEGGEKGEESVYIDGLGGVITACKAYADSVDRRVGTENM